jgi:nicotinate-nucleotide pyrophosphorylase (carboxylating)
MTEIVRLALDEDIGTGDITTATCVPESQEASGHFLAREPLVIAGLDLLAELYETVRLRKRDGDVCAEGEVIAEVSGRARTLLERERVA